MNPQQLTVACEPGAEAAAAFDATLAALPLSFAPTSVRRGHDGDRDRDGGRGDTTRADVVVIDGAPGWASHVADLEAARVVIVVEPEMPLLADAFGRPAEDSSRDGTDASPVAESHMSLPIPVVADRAYAGNPAVAGLAPAIGASSVRSLLELRATVPVDDGPAAALLPLLALARTASGRGVASAHVTLRTARTLVVQGALADGRPVLIHVIASNAVPPEALLRIVDASTSVTASLPSPVAARPAIVTVSAPDGAVRLPTIWQTSHRAAWQRARDVADGEQQGDSLADIRDDAELAARLLKA